MMFSNIKILDRQKDVAGLYNEASLVLNLSDKNKFIETFGMTTLEAMSAGLPVIVPTVGGIAEMVEDGVNGYKIDVSDLNTIASTIESVLSDKSLYKSLALNAIEVSEGFSLESTINQISKIFG